MSDTQVVPIWQHREVVDKLSNKIVELQTELLKLKSGGSVEIKSPERQIWEAVGRDYRERLTIAKQQRNNSQERVRALEKALDALWRAAGDYLQSASEGMPLGVLDRKFEVLIHTWQGATGFLPKKKRRRRKKKDASEESNSRSFIVG